MSHGFWQPPTACNSLISVTEITVIALRKAIIVRVILMFFSLKRLYFDAPGMSYSFLPPQLCIFGWEIFSQAWLKIERGSDLALWQREARPVLILSTQGFPKQKANPNVRNARRCEQKRQTRHCQTAAGRWEEGADIFNNEEHFHGACVIFVYQKERN